jgi:hypothetical protein
MLPQLGQRKAATQTSHELQYPWFERRYFYRSEWAVNYLSFLQV